MVNVMLSLLLAGALLAQSPSVPVPTSLQVGGFVLLTDTAFLGPNLPPLDVPFLTDAQGHAVPRGRWLNRPLKVVRESGSAYLLAQGREQVWLPKLKLSSKSVFPLQQNANTAALARNLSRGAVSVNGQPFFQCEVTPGYHALVTTRTARVSSVWRVKADTLHLAPQGWLTYGDAYPDTRVSGEALLVMLTPTAGVKFLAAELDPNLQEQSVKLMAQVSRRCTALAGIYANADDLYRTLSTAPPVKVPTLPNDPDAQQRALIGWTNTQVLAQYGSPNELGSLRTLLSLSDWTYGADAYSIVRFSFGPDGRVRTAYVARSP